MYWFSVLPYVLVLGVALCTGSSLPYVLVRVSPYVLVRVLPYLLVRVLPYVLVRVLPYVLVRVLPYVLVRLLPYGLVLGFASCTGSRFCLM
mgnify:CR=1 FL=1